MQRGRVFLRKTGTGRVCLGDLSAGCDLASRSAASGWEKCWGSFSEGKGPGRIGKEGKTFFFVRRGLFFYDITSRERTGDGEDESDTRSERGWRRGSRLKILNFGAIINVAHWGRGGSKGSISLKVRKALRPTTPDEGGEARGAEA